VSTARALPVILALVVTLLGLTPLASTGAATAPLTASAISSSCPATQSGVLNSAPSVAGTSKTVALTFDDGPGRSTQAIINILKSFHVRATFFNIGLSIAAYPSLVKEEADDGFLLGDHTNSHPVMPTLSAKAQADEITEVSSRQRRITATVPCVFRPPYGDYNATTISVAHSHGMSVWMWSDEGRDWEARGSGSAYWVHRIESSVIDQSRSQDHPVVLLHNQMISMPATVAALPTIIRSFERRGYAFVDLLGRSGPPGTCGGSSNPPRPTYSSLDSGTELTSGDTRTSPGGQFVLSMGADGQLTYSETGGATLWASPTNGNPGAVASVDHGALSVDSADGATLWTTPPSDESADLQLDSNGNLSLDGDGSELWSSRSALTTLRAGQYLLPGWYVSSPNSRCRLLATPSGALRLTSSNGQVLWSNAPRSPGSRTSLQGSGSLVTTNAANEPVWTSSTPRHNDDFVSVTNKGTVTITTRSGVVIWATQ
jgi:peptidoglycan/xylan/chitin deacetylase (PgdA/CDA1 family)